MCCDWVRFFHSGMELSGFARNRFLMNVKPVRKYAAAKYPWALRGGAICPGFVWATMTASPDFGSLAAKERGGAVMPFGVPVALRPRAFALKKVERRQRPVPVVLTQQPPFMRMVKGISFCAGQSSQSSSLNSR